MKHTPFEETIRNLNTLKRYLMADDVHDTVFTAWGKKSIEKFEIPNRNKVSNQQ